MEFRDKLKRSSKKSSFLIWKSRSSPRSTGGSWRRSSTPAFETMDEYDRQLLVWGKILEKLDDQEQRRVEFVHTTAPSERAEAAKD